MNKTDGIFEGWRAFAAMMKGHAQGSFYNRKIKDGKPVNCVCLHDVFSTEEIDFIKRVVQPEARMCFKNAHTLTSIFPDRVKYVEGEVTICGGALGTEHAWNLVDDKYYVDLTFELVLGKDVTQEGYVALGTYDAKTLYQVTNKTGYYGDIYNYLCFEEYKKKQRKTKKQK